MALLLVKKVTVPAKYSDFDNVFLKRSANVLSKQIKANKHTIEPEKGKQPPYGPIYSLKPVELELFKTYIEINLVIGFIQASKLPADALILFAHKPNDNFYLCVNYQGHNNLTFKNWFSLPLIGKSLDCLD